MTRVPPKNEAILDPERVRDISVEVYKMRLIDGGGSAERMMKDDDDNGEKLRGRAKSYDALTRAYLKVLRNL